MATMMQLGGYTFVSNPETADIPDVEKAAFEKKTFGGVQYFSYGASVKGRTVTLKWSYISRAQYDQLQTLYAADASVNFVPGNGTTYLVEIKSLNAEYFVDQTAAAPHRRNCTMILVILNTV